MECSAQRDIDKKSDSFEYIAFIWVASSIASSLILWEIGGPSSSWAGDMWTSESAPIIIALHSGNLLSALYPWLRFYI